jgi:acyl transferase domain-containing protein/thioesterase domain-containing protein
MSKGNINDRIAVIGMACRFPGANNPEEFWQNLKNGVESLTYFSEQELREAGVAERWLKDPNYIRASTILKEIECFDADFFELSASEARQLDPQQRLLLECAWEALESAGHASLSERRSVGVFAGVRINEYLLFHLPLIDTSGLTTESQLESFQRLVLNDKDFAATRISNRLKLGGPSMSIQTACSTSLVAVHMACQSLLNGECDLALAGGATVRVPQRAGYLHTEGMITSVDGHTRTFDAAASGTVFGSGAGIVALRRLDDALRDGDPIAAVILGSAVNNDAGSAGSFFAPSREGQLRVLEEAYGVAGVSPASLGYLETHGTATTLGDSVECNALLDLFQRHGNPSCGCAIGSVKTNIGHLVHASGIAGLIKTVLMLKHGEFVPSLNFRNPNPNTGIGENGPLYVNIDNRIWLDTATPRRAGVNSFGIGGTNAHVVLEEFSTNCPDESSTPPCSILVLSAKNPIALRELAGRYSCYLSRDSVIAPITSVCFTAAVGRQHFDHRLAIAASDLPSLVKSLNTFSQDGQANGVATGKAKPKGTSKPRVAFLFTGLGSQYPGMGLDLYHSSLPFRDTIDQCDKLLQPFLPKSLVEILSSGELLERTEYAQPALFAIECALARLWISWGIVPDVVLGHSFGEYAAAQVAGVFSLEDGVRLAAQRGRIMQEQCLPGGMAAVSANAELTLNIIKAVDGISIAAYNSPSNSSISGDPIAIQKALNLLGNAGIRAVLIPGNLPFHSGSVEPCFAALSRELQQCQMNPPHTRFISSMTASVLGEDEITKTDYWLKQTREPVHFAESMTTLQEEGYDILIEIGPTPQLLALCRDCWPRSTAIFLPTLRAKRTAWHQISNNLAELFTLGVDINWQAFFKSQGGAQHRVELPNYPFQKARYWIEGPRWIQKSSVALIASELKDSQVVDHRLLGIHLDTPGELIQYQSRICATTSSYIRDHRIFGNVILPGATFIDISLAAWEEVFSCKGPAIIENVSVQRALILKEINHHLLTTIVEPQGENKAKIKIFSKEIHSSHQTAKWQLHSECVIRMNSEMLPDKVSLAALLSRCPEAIQPELFYERKFQKGNAGGVSYRCIMGLWAGQGESLARIEVENSPGDHSSSSAFHPAVLTNCIQPGAENLTVDNNGENGVYLPWVWERIIIFAPLPLCVWSHTHELSSGPDLKIVDVTIFDDNGNVLVFIEKLHFRHATGESLVKLEQIERLEEDLTYTLKWKNGPFSKTECPRRDWVIVGAGEFALALSEVLSARLVLSTNKAGLIRSCFEWRELLENLPSSNGFYGIIYIGSPSGIGDDPAVFELLLCEEILGLIQGVLGDKSPIASQIVFVTQGTQRTGLEKGTISLAGSTLWGLAKSLMREHPNIVCRLVDLDPAVSGKDNLFSLSEELNAGDGETLIAWRNGERLIPRLQHYHLEGGDQSYVAGGENSDATKSLKKIRTGSTYLITGGFGGLGRSVATWLADQGGQSIVLVGRRPPNLESNKFVEGLRLRGLAVMTAAVDVSDLNGMENLFAQIDRDLPPLCGIIHAAGILDDSTLLGMNSAQLLAVFMPKVHGAWNLHRLTEKRPLDFFIMFSSTSGLWGSPGQANYAAANTFLDSLAHYRIQHNLPAISIDWSAWSKVGMAAQMGDHLERHRREMGLGKITPQEGCSIFEWALNQPQAQFVAARVNWRLFRKFLPDGGIASLFSTLGFGTTWESNVSPDTLDTNNSLYLSFLSKSGEDRRRVAVDHIRQCVASVLGINCEKPDDYQQLRDFGLDSLMSLQLKDRVLAPFFELELPWSGFLASQNISSLTDLLIAALEDREQRLPKLAVGGVALKIPQANGQPENSWVDPIQPLGSQPPLFWIMPCPWFKKIALQLGNDQPSYGLYYQTQNVNTISNIDLASFYVDQVLKTRPQGPFSLAGFCIHGHIALEVAHQLHDLGHETPLVILFDAQNRVAFRRNLPGYKALQFDVIDFILGISFHFAKLIRMAPKQWMHYSRILIPGILRRLHIFPVGSRKSNPNDNSKVKDYQPRSYDGRVLLFIAKETQRRRHPFPSYGWKGLLPRLEVLIVPGNHMNMQIPPNGERIIQKLREVLLRR